MEKRFLYLNTPDKKVHDTGAETGVVLPNISHETEIMKEVEKASLNGKESLSKIQNLLESHKKKKPARNHAKYNDWKDVAIQSANRDIREQRWEQRYKFLEPEFTHDLKKWTAKMKNLKILEESLKLFSDSIDSNLKKDDKTFNDFGRDLAMLSFAVNVANNYLNDEDLGKNDFQRLEEVIFEKKGKKIEEEEVLTEEPVAMEAPSEKTEEAPQPIEKVVEEPVEVPVEEPVQEELPVPQNKEDKNELEKDEKEELSKELALPEGFSDKFVFENGRIYAKINGKKIASLGFPMSEEVKIVKIEDGGNGILKYYPEGFENPILLSSNEKAGVLTIQVEHKKDILHKSVIDSKGYGFWMGKGFGVFENFEKKYLNKYVLEMEDNSHIQLSGLVYLNKHGVFNGEQKILEGEILAYRKIDDKNAYILLFSENSSVEVLRRIEISDSEIIISSINNVETRTPLVAEAQEKYFSNELPENLQKLSIKNGALMYANKIQLIDGLNGATYRQNTDGLLEIKKNDGSSVLLDFSAEIEDFFPTLITANGKLIAKISEVGFSLPSNEAAQKYFWNFKEVDKSQFSSNFNEMIKEIDRLNSDPQGVKFDMRTMSFRKDGVSMDLSQMLISDDFDFSNDANDLKEAFSKGEMEKVYKIAEGFLIMKGRADKTKNLSAWGIEKNEENVNIDGQEISLVPFGGEEFWDKYLDKVNISGGTGIYAKELFFEMKGEEEKRIKTIEDIAILAGNKENTEMEDGFDFSVESPKVSDFKNYLFKNLDETLKEKAEANFDIFLASDLQNYLNNISKDISENFKKDSEAKTAEEIGRLAEETKEKAEKEMSNTSLNVFVENHEDYEKISESFLVKELFDQEKEYAMKYYNEDPNMRVDDRYGIPFQDYSKYGLVRKIAQKELLNLVFSLGGAKNPNIPDFGLLPRLLKYAENQTRIFSYISESALKINEYASSESSLDNLKKLKSLIKEQEAEIEKRLKEAQNKIKTAYESADEELGIDSQNVKQRIIFYDDLKKIEKDYHGKVKVNSRYSENNYKSMGMEIRVREKGIAPSGINEVFNKEKNMINSGKSQEERIDAIVKSLEKISNKEITKALEIS